MQKILDCLLNAAFDNIEIMLFGFYQQNTDLAVSEAGNQICLPNRLAKQSSQFRVGAIIGLDFAPVAVFTDFAGININIGDETQIPLGSFQLLLGSGQEIVIIIIQHIHYFNCSIHVIFAFRITGQEQP